MFRAQCIIVFFLSLVIDVLAGWHIRSLVANDLSVAVATIIATYYLGMFGQSLFVDHKSFAKRMWVTTAMAFGAAAGTTIVLFLG